MDFMDLSDPFEFAAPHTCAYIHIASVGGGRGVYGGRGEGEGKMGIPSQRRREGVV